MAKTTKNSLRYFFNPNSEFLTTGDFRENAKKEELIINKFQTSSLWEVWLQKRSKQLRFSKIKRVKEQTGTRFVWEALDMQVSK